MTMTATAPKRRSRTRPMTAADYRGDIAATRDRYSITTLPRDAESAWKGSAVLRATFGGDKQEFLTRAASCGRAGLDWRDEHLQSAETLARAIAAPGDDPALDWETFAHLRRAFPDEKGGRGAFMRFAASARSTGRDYLADARDLAGVRGTIDRHFTSPAAMRPKSAPTRSDLESASGGRHGHALRAWAAGLTVEQLRLALSHLNRGGPRFRG